jgi:hypothetical protein
MTLHTDCLFSPRIFLFHHAYQRSAGEAQAARLHKPLSTIDRAFSFLRKRIVQAVLALLHRH